MKRGCQRWQCKACKHLFTANKIHDKSKVLETYLSGKQTLHQLAEQNKVSPRTIRRWLDKAHYGDFKPPSPRKVILQMDASYWNRNDGLLVIKDALVGDVLWYKFLEKKETISDYAEGIKSLQEQDFEVLAIVSDGLKGLQNILYNTPFQLCQFHQVKFVRFKLTNHPKTDAGKQLLTLSKMLTKTDKESFIGMLDEWFSKWDNYLKERSIGEDGKTHYTHQRLRTAALSIKRNMPVLWTFYDYPQLGIPNTNNAMESFFAQMKKIINLHNGLSNEQKRRLIIDYIIAYNKQKYN